VSQQFYRYPEATPLTLEALHAIDFATVLNGVAPRYDDIWHALADAARTTLASEEFAQARVLWLLSDLCSMMLNPSNPNELFRPFAILEDKRSLAITDVTGDEFDFLESAMDELSTGLVKARVAEVLWITPGRRHIKQAQAALAGYQAVPLNEDTWWRGGEDCWGRALMLAPRLGKAGRDIAEQLSNRLFEALDKEFEDPSPMLAPIAALLLENRVVHSQAADLPSRLEEVGRNLERTGDILRARRCYELSMDAYRAAKDPVSSARMTAALANTWVAEAEVLGDGEGAQPLIALNNLEKALQIYRKVPQRFRNQLGVTELLTRLPQRIADAGNRSVGMMRMISSPPTDISDLVNDALEKVSGKSPTEALHALATLYPFAKKEGARQAALNTLRVGLIGALSGATYLDKGGRVIAKTKPMSFGAEPSQDHEERIWAEMVKNHGFARNLTVQGGVIPALGVMQREHCYKEQDLVGLAKASALIPPERALMVGKGLYWGMVGDFGMAVHFLIPQLENIIRFHMKGAELKTSNTDLEGIENENGLSTLLDVEGVDAVFGADIVFEMKALFCSAFGPNLRNAFAHGLMDDDDFYSADVVYAWWFMLKWVTMVYWAQSASNRQAAAEDQLSTVEGASAVAGQPETDAF
jgi:tetratricopeptide (TPR) repeat protein